MPTGLLPIPGHTPVWIAAQRRGITAHAVEGVGVFTSCGRVIRMNTLGGEARYGTVLDAADAVASYAVRPCARCWPEVDG